MKLIAFFYIKTIKMHVLKLVNKMKRSTRMDQLWSASRADDVTSREACQGLLYTPPHAKTVP